ncbi:MAG TPA: lysylphosphatidylglycerol synthase domain-containing protein [Polyangiaceae bacterium]
MSRSRTIAKHTLAIAIVGCVAYFFYRAARQNWEDVRALDLTPDFLVLSAVGVLMFGALLLATSGWQIAMNSLSSQRKLTFSESVAAVNVSSLTKYVPGKVWSYALQMHWLSGTGIPKSLILYANLLNLGVSLAASTLVGLFCLAAAAGGTRRALLFAVFAAFAVTYAIGAKFYGRSLQWAAEWVSRRLKRQVNYFALPPEAIWWIHVVHLSAAVFWGASAYLICGGIGYPVSASQAALIIGSTLIGDVLGFLAIVVPGGLGVREGVILWLLGGASFGPLALILPIVSRVISMVIEVGLGVVAFLLLRRLVRPSTPATTT